MTLNSMAQEATITGKVVDEPTGEPLPGAGVVIKGTTTGASTNLDGNFTINVKPTDTLVISFIGYVEKEIPVGNQQIINVQLSPETIGMDEVVVIGYGTVKKEDATGAVEVVTSDDFNKGAITSPQDLLVGKASGVLITQNDGAPGSSSIIRIRGGSSLSASNDPLIIIDGLPVSNVDIGGFTNPLSTINPNDIESMTILKDASATAIYGSRASNGVIIITTKQGAKGKVKVSYNGNVSYKTPVELTEVFSGDEFRSLIYDRVQNHDLNTAALNRLGTEDTDWQDEVYVNSISTDHNLSVSGALKDIPVRASVGYTVDNGILKYSSMKRSTVALNANPSFLDDHLSVGVNMKGGFSDWNYSNSDALGASVSMDPTQPIKNGNTRYGGYFTWTQPGTGIDGQAINIATSNPVAKLEYRDNTSNVIRTIANVTLDYKFHFLPELRANLNVGSDYTTTKGDDIQDARGGWTLREPQNNVKSYDHTADNRLLDFYFNYVKDIEPIKSKVDLTVGYGWQHYKREGTSRNRDYEANDEGIWASADTIDYAREYYIVSFFGRLNYSFLDRYLLTSTLRYDGSSRFSKDNRWGMFPSFAFAWKVNKEAFLQDISAISDLKVRIGYGITGQQDIGNDFVDFYPYLATYQSSTQGQYYQFGDQFYPTWRPNAYDVNLKWEETTTQNIGLDFGFYKNRITGTIDLYKRETKDLLNDINIAAGTNFSNYLITNVGSLENKGVEVTLNAKAVSTPDLVWEIGCNFSYNKNEVTKLNQFADEDYLGVATGKISGGVGSYAQRHQVGYPANTFFLYKQVYDENGMPIEGVYIDKTGNGGEVGTIEDNKYYLESAAPDYTIGISSSLSYKQFDFSFSCRTNIGNYVYNNVASSQAIYQNIYNQAGYSSNIPKAVQKSEFQTAQYFSDFYLENGSFFKMDNISLGYRFNQIFTERLSGRVAFTIQNVFTITDYSGLDPEVTNEGNIGIDNNPFPRPRTFMLGFNIDF